MNELHLQICGSDEWAEYLASDVIPWALKGVDLGDDVLEVGPGPGRTTEVLRTMTDRLTAIEIDPDLAAALADRLGGSNVNVVRGDASEMEFPDNRFSAALSFTMLHHVPSAELQDRLFSEVNRVLRTGATFVGFDSVDSDTFRELHVDDICVPIDPEHLPDRLARAGFDGVTVDTNELGFRFRATAGR